MNLKNKPLNLIHPSVTKSESNRSNEPKLFGYTAVEAAHAIKRATAGLASFLTPGAKFGKNISKNVGKTGFPKGSYMDKFHSKTGLNKAFFDRVKKNTGATDRTSGNFPFIKGSGRH